MINQTVKTPIGEGVNQGNFHAQGAPAEQTVTLVRLPVNDETGKHLQDTNCLTPRAVKTALFFFPPSEVGKGWIEYAIITAAVLLITLMMKYRWPW